MTINRDRQWGPLLAATMTKDEIASIRFPIMVSPKIDGIRGVTPHVPLGIYDTTSRRMEPIPNVHVRANTREWTGLDGEFVITEPNDIYAYDLAKSAIMTQKGEPDFTYWVFDYYPAYDQAYYQRYRMLERVAHKLPSHIKLVEHTLMYDLDTLLEYEHRMVDTLNYEGIMLNDPLAAYKWGRSTFNEGILFKWKRMERTIATIVGFEEQMKNLNAQETNNLGYAKRSSAKAGKVPAGTLGAFVCQAPEWGVSFNVGTGEGLTKKLRQAIWDNRALYMGRKFIMEFQLIGSKDRPRIPSYKRFADDGDM